MEERMREVEVGIALLEQRLEESIRSDEEFKKEVIATLDCIKQSNIERDQANIKRDLAVDNLNIWLENRAEFWTKMREKLTTSGIWAVIVGMGIVLWYAFTNFIKSAH